VQALRVGDKGQAERLAALAVQGDPQGFDVRTWQAQVLRALGKPQDAEEAFRKLTVETPAEPRAWFQLLMLQASQGKTAEAAATLEAMRARVKPETLAGRSPDLFWAYCYRAVGKLDQAVEACRAALRKEPASAAVFQAVVAFFDQTGLPRLRAEAVEMLQAVVDRDKENGWARRELAERLAARPNDRASWERALAIVGPEPRPDDQAADTFTRARVYAQSPVGGDRQKAIAILQKLADELPNDTAVQDQLARLLLADHRPAEARAHAAKAAESSQAGLDSIVAYAGALIALKDADAAAKQVERLEQIAPNDRPVLDLKVKLLTLQGKPAEAAAVLEKAFDGAADAADAQTFGETVALMLRDLGQPVAAERVARKLAAKGAQGRCTLAKILATRGGDHDQAAALLELEEAGKSDSVDAGTTALSVALTPKSDPRWLALADRFLTEAQKAQTAASDPRETLALLDKLTIVRHIQKRYPEEVALYQQMLALKPASPTFLNNLAWTLSEEMNNPREGIKWADEAIKALGPQPALLDTRGVVLTRLGRYDEAVHDLDAAVRATPSGSFLYHLARTYRKMNRPDDARSCRDRARAAGLTREQLQPSEQADWDAVMTL
jgi:tetratricopeptide (TPR) repeat protein